jgi:hypothetical protein
MQPSSRLVVLGAFALTLLASLVHVACTASESVASGGADLSQNSQTNAPSYGDDDDDGYGYGYGYGYGAAMNVAPDTSE